MRPLRSGRRSPGQRGVSLIEALVALAVMAFGILGVVGVQATLRANADNSRQRAEALRIAQQGIETWRGFVVIPSPAPAGQTAYGDIATTAPVTYTDPNYNTTYTLQMLAAPADVGRAQSVVAQVTWNDRGGNAQSVSLASTITGIPPEMAGSLLLPGNAAPAQQAMGRSSAIPQGAVDQGNGTSNFSPPGSSGLTWVFNNTTGVITSICNPTCSPANGLLLTGYINFSTGGPPSASNPVSAAFPVGVVVNVTYPPATPQVQCYQQAVAGSPSVLAYYCAVPVATAAPPAVARWSGQSDLVFVPTTLLSTSLSDLTAGNFKVCRYTTVQGNSPPNGNVDHPLNYSNVSVPLLNQNFLVVSAPFVTSLAGCPTDGTITYGHQPVS